MADCWHWRHAWVKLAEGLVGVLTLGLVVPEWTTRHTIKRLEDEANRYESA